MRLSLPCGLFLTFAFSVHVILSLQVIGDVPWSVVAVRSGYFRVALIGLSLATSVYQAMTPLRAGFRIATMIQIVALLGLTSYLSNSPVPLILAGAIPVLALSLFEKYPLNLSLSVICSLVIGTAGGSLGSSVLSLEASLAVVAVYAILLVVAVSASATIKYRECLIDLQNEYLRLDRSFDQIAKTNQEYQDSLVKVEAEAIDEERKRITRDIHDTVAYTLTNNLMLMEAATDVMRTDPIRVSRLLNTARENAEDGLTRIRETLYALRAREEKTPHGTTAIHKLVRNFEAATGIDVRVDFTNTPVHLTHTIEVTLYHIVQESITNSFRHGEAKQIDVLTSLTSGALRVVIIDNGIGSSSVKEGIGIKGMKERVARVGGTVTYNDLPYGFQVTAVIPWSDEK